MLVQDGGRVPPSDSSDLPPARSSCLIRENMSYETYLIKV